MKVLKIGGLLIAALCLTSLSIGTVEARGGHRGHHCSAHKHLDQGTMHCVWNYGYKKSHK
jgi:hypothetical protein